MDLIEDLKERHLTSNHYERGSTKHDTSISKADIGEKEDGSVITFPCVDIVIVYYATMGGANFYDQAMEKFSPVINRQTFHFLISKIGQGLE